MPHFGLFAALVIANYVLAALAIAELCYSRPPGWGLWVASILIVPGFWILSLMQAPRSIAYRRRNNALKAAAAKHSFVGEPPRTEPPGS